MWEDYKSRRISRTGLGKKNYHTSYIFSILHLVEEEAV